jgi:hypothetical protein
MAGNFNPFVITRGAKAPRSHLCYYAALVDRRLHALSDMGNGALFRRFAN